MAVISVLLAHNGLIRVNVLDPDDLDGTGTKGSGHRPTCFVHLHYSHA